METTEHVKWKRGYHGNGKLWWEYPCVNDKRHGLSRGWHSNGKLWWETPYVNGQLHGMRRGWNKNDTFWFVQKWRRNQKLIQIELCGEVPSDMAMELDLTTNIMSYE